MNPTQTQPTVAESEGGGTAPRWAVVVPTFNRPEALRQAVAALSRLDPPEGGFEVVVVDDGGVADLAFVERTPGCRLVGQANAGPAAARNRGAATTGARCLAFTDDDCRPRADWLTRLDAVLQQHPEALVGGHTVNALTGNAFSAASQDVVDYLYRVENAEATRARFFTSNNIALRRQAFEAAGGFDETFPLAAGEDRAFCDRWAASGRPLVHAPEAVVDHHHRLGPGRFWRQHFTYGRGAWQLRLHRARHATRDPRRPPAGFYRRLLLQPFAGAVPGRRGSRCLLLGFAQLATAAGYWHQRRLETRDSPLPRLEAHL